jgi:hypothetical protein
MNLRLKDIDKRKSVRLNAPTANLVSKEVILKNLSHAEDAYAKGVSLRDIDFEGEGETSPEQRYHEFRDNVVSDSVKKLKIGSSIYEHAFWVLYHEDCPKVINETVQRCAFSMLATIFLTGYILDARLSAYEGHIYYGGW